MSEVQSISALSRGMIRIAVRENSRMATELLCAALAREHNFEVVGIAEVAELTSPAPQILLVSASTPSRSACETIEQLRRKHPETKAILLVEEARRELVVDAFRAGARGVFSRSEPFETLRKCIISVSNGQVWANQSEIGFLLGAINEPMPMPLVDAKGTELLSKREQSVVRCVAEGFTNREIADQLKLSEHTVKNYLFRIFDKLGVSSRVELIIYAVSRLAPSSAQPASQRERRTAQEDPAAPASCSDVSTLAQQFRPYVMAELHREGRGVPRDKVVAFMWFKVAEALAGDLQGLSRQAQQELRAALSSEQISDALQRAAEMLSPRTTNVTPIQVSRSAARPGIPISLPERRLQKVRCADTEG